MKNLVILGASGDLARVKLFPALWEIYQKGFKCNYWGYGRTDYSVEDFKSIVKDSVPNASDIFYSNFKYISGNYDFQGLSKLKTHLVNDSSIFYLAIPTKLKLVEDIILGLKKSGLLEKNNLVVIEKPFGNDYSSAKELMRFLEENINESRLFFIDHYLSKSLVRNLISLRFANPIFENLWSNKFIEQIEISAFEDVGIKDRGNYYDDFGAIKDMIQNHLLQILALTTMDSPQGFDFRQIHKEKEKILNKVQIFNNEWNKNVEIGQYEGYLNEKDINKDSLTETFAKLKVEVKNPRWEGVPMILSTGKKQKEKKTQIVITFKSFSNCLWGNNCSEVTGNKLTINISPKNNLELSLNSDVGELKNPTQKVNLSFDFDKDLPLPLPYANTLIDVYNSDKSYTASINEILYSWKFIDKVEEYLEDKRKSILKKY